MTDLIQPPDADDAARRERTRAERRAYYEKNSERINAERRRRYAADAEYRVKVLADNRKTAREHRLRRTYGISLEDYDRMFARQGGRCAICWKTSKQSLCVDHSHRTSMLRALLCISCNVGFGNFFENPAFLRRAADYAEFFSAHEEEIVRDDPALLQDPARLRERMLNVDISSLLPSKVGQESGAGRDSGASAERPPGPPASAGVAPTSTDQPAKPAGKKNAQGSIKQRSIKQESTEQEPTKQGSIKLGSTKQGSTKLGSTKRRSTKRRQHMRPHNRARGAAPTAPATRGGRSRARRQTHAPARSIRSGRRRHGSA